MFSATILKPSLCSTLWLWSVLTLVSTLKKCLLQRPSFVSQMWPDRCQDRVHVSAPFAITDKMHCTSQTYFWVILYIDSSTQWWHIHWSKSWFLLYYNIRDRIWDTFVYKGVFVEVASFNLKHWYVYEWFMSTFVLYWNAIYFLSYVHCDACVWGLTE